MKKVVLFAFNGESMCFVHVLLNGLNLKETGYDVKIVIEGAATKLIPEMNTPGSPLHGLSLKAKEQGIIHGVCRACSVKMGTSGAVEAMGLNMLDDMSGHPSLSKYLSEGYTVITF